MWRFHLYLFAWYRCVCSQDRESKKLNHQSLLRLHVPHPAMQLVSPLIPILLAPNDRDIAAWRLEDSDFADNNYSFETYVRSPFHYKNLYIQPPPLNSNFCDSKIILFCPRKGFFVVQKWSLLTPKKISGYIFLILKRVKKKYLKNIFSDIFQVLPHSFIKINFSLNLCCDIC